MMCLPYVGSGMLLTLVVFLIWEWPTYQWSFPWWYTIGAAFVAIVGPNALRVLKRRKALNQKNNHGHTAKEENTKQRPSTHNKSLSSPTPQCKQNLQSSWLDFSTLGTREDIRSREQGVFVYQPPWSGGDGHG